VKLVWSKAALRDLFEIAEYIARDSERTAELVEVRIHETAALIVQFPRIGRVGRVTGTRERAVPDTPYILAYRILSNRVRILGVYRGARRWPARFD
jgi:addiction module RelE/StbE family toxin